MQSVRLLPPVQSQAKICLPDYTTSQIQPRREIDRVAANSSTETEAKRARHSCLASVVANIKRMALGQWKFEEHETLVKLSLYDNEQVLPKF